MGAGRTSLRSEAAFGGEPRGRRLHHAIFARFRLARGAAAWFISESVVRSTGLLASVGLFSTNKEDFMAAQDSREQSSRSKSGDCIVRGMARCRVSHPLCVVGEGGRTVTIAEGTLISSYYIVHTNGTVDARLRWSRETNSAVTALADAGNGRLIATRSHENTSRVEIIDSAGEGRDLIEVAGHVCAIVAAGPYLYVAVRRDPFGRNPVRD